MSDEQKGGLFDPDNFGSGGFFDDVDATIVSAEVNTWGEAPDKCFAIVGLQKDAGEGEEPGEPRIEYYTIGDLDKFTPSKDRTRPVYEEGAKINGGTKFALFIKSLIHSGFPKGSISDDVRFLIGVRGHFNLVPITIKADSKKFKGPKKEGGDGPKVLIMTKLLDAKAPVTGTGTASRPAATGAAKSASAPAAAPAAAGGNVAAEEAAVGVLLEKLAESGELVKRNLPNLMFQNIKDVDVRKVAMKLVGDSTWLGSPDRPWKFDEGSGTLTM
jgi:hypothetical protein